MNLSILFKDIKRDLQNHNGNNVFKVFTICFTNPSFRLILNYRIGRYLILKESRILNFLAKCYKYKQITKRGCHISYKSKLGYNIKFPHPIGIVIGDGVEVRNNVMIWQNVTLGSHGKKNGSSAYPIICENVRIYEGATIIGDVNIGNGAIIGAKALVNINVPPSRVAIGIPAKLSEI